MKQKKIPLRTCIISKEKLPKQQLLRIVRNTSGEVLIDETGKINGRGCYLKKDIDVIKKAQKQKVIERELDTEIPDELYEKIENMIK